MKNTRKTINFKPYYSLHDGLKKPGDGFVKIGEKQKKEKLLYVKKDQKNKIKKLINFEKEIKKIYESGKIKAPIHLSGNNEIPLIKIFKK